MRKLFTIFACLIASASMLLAQQLPNSDFEDWSGEKFDGKEQPKSWYASNVEQVGFKFCFISKENGHTGKCAMVQDKEVGAFGITEVGPGYMGLGISWQKLDGLNTGSATAGMYGGLPWTWRPDSMQVWVRRTGENWSKEDFHIIYYAWSGASKGSRYKNKNGGCTNYNATDEESDIRTALDGNECGTDQYANQIAEGWVRDRKEYNDWTLVTVPIYYMNDVVPEKCNVILSAGNYPNFRANSGLYQGNSLYVDDIKMIYSSKIQSLYVGGKKWNGFISDTEEEQTYSLGEKATEIPEIYAVRGEGTLTNARGGSASFPGRKLTSSEMQITQGKIDGEPTIIKVTSADGSSTHTYRIKFVRAASTNSKLANILVNGQPLENFNPNAYNYSCALPYGTQQTPVVTVVQAEDAQTVSITQATSTSGTATIKVTAADKKTTSTYNVQFSVALLSDNTLQDILIDGLSLTGFLPTKNIYTVELPLGTTKVPEITPVSAYPAGEQRITKQDNGLDGTYQISVTAPGNATTRVYKLNFKITASSYVYLRDIQLDGKSIEGFTEQQKTYSFGLPSGTTSLPVVTWTPGDPYQTVVKTQETDDDGNEVVKLTVTAANGDQLVYRIIFSITRSTNAFLDAIYLDGKALEGFASNKNVYTAELPIGTTTLPVITYKQGDDYQTVVVNTSAIDPVTHTATCRINVTAESGDQYVYAITFVIAQADNTTLNMIYVNGVAIEGFRPEQLEYDYVLPLGTKAWPTVTYDKHDEYQTVSERKGTFSTTKSNPFTLMVKAQSGASASYVINFTVAAASTNTRLSMLYVDGEPLADFDAAKTQYTFGLSAGTSKVPTVSADKGEAAQTLTITQAKTVTGAATVKVLAEDKRTSATYTVQFSQAQSAVVALSAITVGGQLIEGFDPEKTEYNLVLPVGTQTLPTIGYTKGDAAQTVTVRNNVSNMSGDYMLVVTAQNGDQRIYTIHVSTQVSTNTNLQMIYVDGKPLAGFAASTLRYTISLPVGTTKTPAITWTAGDSYQTIAFVDGGLQGESEIIVKAQDGVSVKTYVLTYVIEKANNTTLQMIYLDGQPIADFAPEKTDYQVDLKSTTTVLPEVTFLKHDEYQTVLVRRDGMSGLEGDYKLVVTAQTGDTRTYTLHFSIVVSSNASLASILVGGEPLSNFDPDVLDYVYHLPMGTTEAPAISWVAGDEFQQISATLEGLDGKNEIVVVAQDGTKRTYTISFDVVKSDNTMLAQIYVGGVAIADFEQTTMNYTVELPEGTQTVPEITYQKNVSTQQVTIIYGDIDGETLVVVASESGSSSVYRLRFSVAKSALTTLRAIYVGGQAVAGFAADKYDYEVQLPSGFSTCPAITVDKGNAAQRVNITIPKRAGMVTIDVVAENGDKAQYRVMLLEQDERSNMSQLAGITVGGVALAGFDPAKTQYQVMLPAGTTVLPLIVANPGHPGQQIAITRGTVMSSTYIRVLAEDEKHSTVYEIAFSVEQSTTSLLKQLLVDGVDILEDGVYEYTQTVVPAATACPEVEAVKGDLGQNIVITRPHLLGDAVIYVTASDRSMATYLIHFVSGASSEATLQSIMLDGVEIEGYAAAQNYYDIELPVGTTTLPAITVDKADASQQVSIFSAGVNGLTAIRVVAEDGTTNVYELQFNKPKENIAGVSMIYLDGAALADFSAAKKDYEFVLADDQIVAPQVTAATTTSLQSLNIVQPLETGVASITAYSEDMEQNETYTVRFRHAVHTDATLASISLNGEPLVGFDSQTFDYEVDVMVDDLAEDMAVSFVRNSSKQTVLVENNGKEGVRIYVYAEDGSSNVYVISYNLSKSDVATLEDIRLYDTDSETYVSLPGFASDVESYTYSLKRHTKAAPSVYPVLGNKAQSIEVNYGAVDEETVLTVTAEDGLTQQVYRILFETEKSSDASLSTLYIDDVNFEYDLEFAPEKTAYDIEMPRGTTSVPSFFYERNDADQLITYILRPLGEVSEIRVTAENGETRVYTLYFHTPVSTQANTLLSMTVAETGEKIVPASETEFVVNLPYGTRTMTVDYEKAFPEQTVFVQPGGVLQPTLLTVRGNREDDEDVVYTLTPVVSTANPAVLSGITVDGVTIEGFTPERYSYVVRVKSAPVLKYALAPGAQINILHQTSKQWQAEVSFGEFTNVYTVWYFYEDDIVPNMDFTDWSNCAVYTSAQKPTGWNTIADVLGRHSGFGTFDPNQLCTQSGDKVHLSARYSTPGGGTIPAFITLGQVTGSWGVAGSSTFSISGGIAFHNSPDEMKVNYSASKINQKNIIQYTLIGSQGTKTLEWNDNTAFSQLKEVTFDLTEANQIAGEPTLMNIVFDAYRSISSTTGNVGTGSVADMEIDYIRFVYNSRLTGINVNGIDAEKEGNAFSVVLTNPEQTLLPTLTFVGEVADQAQQVAWTEEDEDGVRTAEIRNFAEDGTYTDYTLSVRRPKDARTELSSLLIGGAPLASFDAEITDYEVHLASSVHQIPDVQCAALSSMAAVNCQYADSTMTITVTSETGAERQYTVRFITDLSDDATLASIAGLDDFAAETTDYVVSEFADYLFVKQMDGQTVTYQQTADQHLLHVVAENGAEKTYTITKTVAPVVSGKLTDIRFNDNTLDGFASDKYDYETNKIVTKGIAFTRENPTDKVVVRFYPEYIEWTLTASNGDVHVYTLTHITPDKSKDAGLAMIYVDDAPLADYSELVADYTVRSSLAAHSVHVARKEGQKVTISYADSKATIDVVAEDGVTTQSYTVTFQANKSDNNALQMIYVGDAALAGFDPETLFYDIVLAAPTAPKAEDASMPSVRIETAAGQTVEILNQGVGSTMYIDVKAETGTTRTYELNIATETMTDASLQALFVNGKQVALTDATEYDVEVETDDVPVLTYYTWSPAPYQEAIDMQGENELQQVVTVTAEDGTEREYIINCHVSPAYYDATMAAATLDGVVMEEFRSDFGKYTVNVAADAASIPTLTLTQSVDNQQVAVVPGGVGDTIQVGMTAVDGVTEYGYSFYFGRPKSSDASLLGISIDYEPIAGFSPEQTEYTVDINNADYTVQYVKSTLSQQVFVSRDGQVTQLIVVAEDGTTRVYKVHVHVSVSQNSNPYLTAILLDGEMLADFASTRTSYTIQLPAGTTSLPDIETRGAADGQQIIIDYGTVTTATTIHVLAQDNVTSMDYILHFGVEKSSVATLRMLFVDNKMVEGFDPDTLHYDVTLPVGTRSFPEVSYTEGERHQSIVKNLVSFSNDKAEYAIQVTAEDGTQRVYTITMEILKSDVTTLRNILVNGQSLSTKGRNYMADFDFAPEQETYAISWNIGTTTMPSIEFVAADTLQKLTVLHSMLSLDDSVIVRVQAENGDARTYTVYNTLLHSDVDTLSMIYIGSEPLADFDAQAERFEVTMPVGTRTWPTITAVRGSSYQLEPVITPVSMSAYEALYRIDVTAEAGNSRSYFVHFTTEKSALTTLRGIRVNSLPLVQEGVGYTADADFDADRNEYHLTWAVGTTQLPEITYQAGDQYQTINYVNQMRSLEDSLIIRVISESGDQNDYIIYNTLAHDHSTRLKMIYVNSRELEGFDPEKEEFVVSLPVGTRQYPTYEFEAENRWQKISSSIVTQTAYERVVRVDVVAEDGQSTGTYTLRFEVQKSSVSTLAAITLDGAMLTTEGDSYTADVDFDAQKTTYHVSVNIGAEAPEVGYEQGDEYQSVMLSQRNDTVFIRVQAENGDVTTYRVEFSYMHSACDVLQLIYIGGDALSGFRADSVDYTIMLPVGTRQFPDVDYDKGDDYQMVRMDTLLMTTYEALFRIRVEAEDGLHVRNYTIKYVILKSEKNWLEAIYLDDKMLAGFTPDQLTYDVVLPSAETPMPVITWDVADKYETVSARQVQNIWYLDVTSESGATRTYVLSFSVQRSSNTQLDDIKTNGTSIPNFDPENHTYRVNLPYGTTQMPVVTWQAHEAKQTVTIAYDIAQWQAVITVLAENGVNKSQYTINFSVARSDADTLQMIYLDGEQLTMFAPREFEYDVVLPCGTETMPVVTWKSADDQQQVEAEVNADDWTVVLGVTSGDGDHSNEYTIRFEVAKSSDKLLTDLRVSDETIDGFKPETYEYHLEYEAGTDVTDLATPDDVTAVTADSRATVAISINEEYTLVVTVTAEDGSSIDYMIYQDILLPSNALLETILLDSVQLATFDPQTMYYEYLLPKGTVLAPSIVAVPQDSTAEVSLTIGQVDSIPYTIYCTAQSGDEMEYQILFRTVSYNAGEAPSEQDVLFRNIAGSYQFLAATTRMKTQIALYSDEGHLLMLRDVPVCDPNAAVITNGIDGINRLDDVTDPAQGVVIDLEPNRLYFYSFIVAGKTIISSGKVYLL